MTLMASQAFAQTPDSMAAATPPPAPAPGPESHGLQVSEEVRILTLEDRREFDPALAAAWAASPNPIHRNRIALPPFFHAAAHVDDPSRRFSAGRAGQGNFDRQARFFEPQIEMIQTATLDLDDHFIGCWLGFR